jgi:hypothetical protein
MPIVSILIFLGSFIAVSLGGIFVFVVFYNKRTKPILDKFILHSDSLNPIIFKNIKIRYWTVYGGQMIVYPNNQCDLFLLEDCLGIVRRQDFIYKVFFPPFLISSDIIKTRNTFSYLNIFKPEKVLFKQTTKSEVDIKLIDPAYKHSKIDITLKGLTNEQINQLKKIKSLNL